MTRDLTDTPAAVRRWWSALPLPVATLLPAALGLAAGLALGAWALRSPAAAGLLLLVLPPAAHWQGRRVRLAGTRAGGPAGPQPAADPLIGMIELPGGRFRMGSLLDWRAYGHERPRRRVTLSPFAMARTPVTRGLYRSLAPDCPAGWGPAGADDTLPATSVSWEDAVQFCNRLSERSGRGPCYRRTDAGWDCDWTADGYRLPTEAEWEYACRAGTRSPWFWGWSERLADRFAWYSGNSGFSLHPVALKKPNRWGFHDLAGNCWEWCWDWYDHYDRAATIDPRGPHTGRGRVLRGGSFVRVPGFLRSAGRLWRVPGHRNDFIGFRCVRGSGRQPVP